MKSIIITGATGSIGYECALYIAKNYPQYQIVLPYRNQALGKETIQKLKVKSGHQNIISLPLDFNSLESVRRFIEQFAAQPHNKIAALINNAGLQNVQETAYTSDGFEVTFGVNHLAPLYMTIRLLPYMEPDSTITFTASGTHDPRQKSGMPAPIYTSAKELAYPSKTDESLIKTGQIRYTTSKLCNVLTAYALQKHLSDTNIHVNAFDPGFIPGTGLGRNYPALLQYLMTPLLKLTILLPINAHTAGTSGKRLGRVALGEVYPDAKGKYFEGEKMILSSDQSYDERLQKDLWNGSMELLKLRAEDIV